MQGLACRPICAQVMVSSSSSKVPKPPGSTMKASANSWMRALRSCMVGTISSEMGPYVRDFAAVERIGQHADDLAAGSERRIGDAPIRPRLAPP